jgi:hypothetical protein
MLLKINEFIVNCSQSWWKFLLLVGGFVGTLMTLTNISAKFPAATDGYEPFDMQNGLTDSDIFTQLATYTPEAFQLYSWFQAVDYLFPLFAGLMLAAAGAFGLRHAWPAAYAKAETNKLLALFMIPSLFDWLENLSLLRVITAWPDQSPLAATFAVGAKAGKLSSMNVVFALIGLLLLAAAIRWIVGKLSKT